MLCLYAGNKAAEVEEALESAFLKQNLPPEMLIVVFDGPVDDAVTEVIDRFAATHETRRIVHQTCQGHGLARAAAIAACDHDWIAIIDADDVSLPDRFRTLINHARAHPDAAVIGGGLTEFHDTAGERVLGAQRDFPESPEDVRRFLASRSPVAQPTAILRTKAIREVGNYQTWYGNEDYHLWIRLVAAGFEIRNVADTVLLFRTNPALYGRRGGLRYWLSEVRLQLFSYKNGTTTFGRLVLGGAARFVVQVLMPQKLRAVFYQRILRKL